MKTPHVFELNNKINMPQIGLGVLFAKNDGQVENAVLSALSVGYRKIDTASAYQNEQGVGKGIKKVVFQEGMSSSQPRSGIRNKDMTIP